jgi:hypothetical protein
MSFIGKIYRIEFPDGYFYIGSTCRSIKRRLQEHKNDRMKNLEATLKIGYPLRSRFDMYLGKNGWNNPIIFVIQEHEVSSKKELHTLEDIEINKMYDDKYNLNDRCPGRPRIYTGGKIKTHQDAPSYTLVA